jgi:WD40 repeat protein
MSTAQLADPEHPWIGLASFTESDSEFFAGRGEEIDELLRLVRRDTLTLLYGVSGLGKTSLLQAGLFPALRTEDYLPVPIRLDYVDGAPPLSQQVLSAITKAAAAAGVEAPVPLPGETLWEYFHRESNHFWSPRNDLVTPFLVFDQFEECFTLGRETPGRGTRASEFISELADLVENRPPAALRGDPQRAREFSFKPRPLKVLLAMREDYLAELDRIRSQFRALGQNRLRLLPMGLAQARQVINLGAPLMAPGVEDRIVRFVAGSAADDSEITVAPALLSLVLQQLNERRLEHSADAKITAELLDMQQKKIFEDFYLRTLKPFDPGVGTFIEDRLLTASGFRNSCALDDALSCPGVTQPTLDELVNFRLLAYEDRHRVRRVEITHDVLAPVIRASRDNRISREALAKAERQKAEAREKERVARHRLLVVGSLLVLSVIAGASFGLWKASVANEQTILAKAETAKANKQTAWAEELQEQKTEQATRGELTAANDLKLEEEWASRLVHLDRALSYSGAVHYPQQNAAAAAKWANRRAKQHATAAAALWAELRYGAASRAPLIRAFIESKTTIQHMVWSPKEPLLATAGFRDVLLWSFSGRESTDVSPQRCDLTDPSTGEVTGLRFSADGKTLLVVRNKRWELISVAKKKLIFTSPPTELLLAGDPFSPDGMQVVTRPEGSAPHIIRTDIPDDPGAPVSISQIEIPIAPGVDVASPSSKGVVVAWSPKGDRIALADEKRMISVYSISKAGVTLLLPNAIEAFADVAPLRAAMNNPIEVKGLSFDESGDLLLVKDEKGINPLFEIWTVNSTGAKRLDRASAKFRAWIPKRSVLLDIPIGDGPPVISNGPFRKGRALAIKDPGAPRFSTDGPAALFIQSKRNYQVLDLETGYPITPPFGWWLGPITARLALSPGLIASVENKSELAFWDLRPEQRRWHADPPQPQPLAPVRSPDEKWLADISVDQRVVVGAPSDDDWHLLVVISLDEQPTSVGWSADSRYLRIYSKVRGLIDVEWDPPTVMEEPIHKLVELLIRRKDKAPAERFELRKEMSMWKAKDPRWQKLLDWWTAGRPDEVPSPNAQLLTDIPSDGAISSPPVGRDPESSVWVFHDSNTRPLTDVDLRSLSVDDLWRARNEIFARRGVKIRGDRGRSLIEKLGSEFHDSGIEPDPAYDLMNGIEKANILLIKSIESQRLTGQ